MRLVHEDELVLSLRSRILPVHCGAATLCVLRMQRAMAEVRLAPSRIFEPRNLII